MRRVAAAGAAAAVVYAAVVAVTGVVSDRDVRPLFDATGPPPVYRWVKPPPDFAAGNVRPRPVEITFGLKPEDPPPAGASEDQQLVFSLPRGAVAEGPAGEQLAVRVEPHGPDTLGALPPATFADGNAYLVTLRYEPGGAPVTLTRPGSLLLTVPVPATGVMFSEDGKAWRRVTSRHASANTVGAEFPAPGYYLAVTPDVIGFSEGDGGVARLLLPIVVTVGVAAALVGVPVMARRRRGRA